MLSCMLRLPLFTPGPFFFRFGKYPFNDAVQYSYFEVIQLLAEAGADVNEYG